MFYIFCLIIFLLGLCVGSFLNTVIYRLKSGESILFLRSHCPYCKHALGFFDLIPVLSFIFLGGKCRYCGKRISWQYPMVELATGILFVLFFLQIFNFQWFDKLTTEFSIFNQLSIINYQLSISLILQLFFVSILIIIFVYDLKWSIIPDKIVWPGIAIALLASLFLNHQLSIINYQSFLSKVLAAVIAGGFFLLFVLVSREKWMGWGDVKLGILIGLILGWPNILVALFLAFVSGALIGGSLVLAKRKTLKSQIPFGPFLCGSTIVAMLVGERILSWYLGMLG